MSNHLSGESSPYLLQHAKNPVDWYPWGQEAFDKALAEDKPVFLSIGYSTCHWCHVMAHESFEDKEIASILNRYFIAVKVDKEERPDIDSIYMAVCQALTGSGGWPTSIFMTPERKPFFAGTYFPKTSRYGSPGLKELLLAVHEKWTTGRTSLLRLSENIVKLLNGQKDSVSDIDGSLAEKAISQYRQSYDGKNGGFGNAPKFPAAHNLLFLMQQYRKGGDSGLLEMAEKTLLQMYRGGIFDHIGGGFCRYSTDPYYLVPHFEKMLYDNALLIIAYSEAYRCTGKELYKEIAIKTTKYILRDMKSAEGGFYSAQDADSDGEEGKYYVFSPPEIKSVIGEEEGEAFCRYYDITDSGNFEGKSIPNLLRTGEISDRFDSYLPKVRKYRESRTALHTDDKILTLWNSLMIAALCSLYRITGDGAYMQTAKTAELFIEQKLCDGSALYVSWRDGKRGVNGFADDYAGHIYALLALYEATFDNVYLDRARRMVQKTSAEFFDAEQGGYYLYGNSGEALIARTKECYDGALPSGNSLMAYNLVRLNYLQAEDNTKNILQKQLGFMSGKAAEYPSGYAVFLMALSDYTDPEMIVTAVRGNDDLSDLPFHISSDIIVKVLDEPCEGFMPINGESAFYVCRHHSCHPPVNKTEFYRMLDESGNKQRRL